MASRVNKKFVILLSAFLVLTGVGAGGAYYFVKMRSGEHYVAMGDRAMKEGKIDSADTWYERAVGKEQYNVEWLKKWRGAREQKVPAHNVYGANYQMLQGILRNLAQAQKTNIEAHREYLESIKLECVYSGARGGWEYVSNHVDEVLAFFESDPANPQPPQIRRYRGLAVSELMSDPTVPKDRVELAKQDLEAALKLDPLDGEAANALAVWHRVMADRAKTEADDAARSMHLDRSREVLKEAMTHTFPAPFATPHPLVAVSQLIMEAADVDVRNPSNTEDAIREKVKALNALSPRVQQVADVLEAADPRLVSPVIMSRFASIAPRINTQEGTAIAIKLVDRLLVKRPDDMDLLIIRAQLLSTPQAPPAKPTPPEQLIAAYQAVVDLPDKPVSFQGLRLLSIRTNARFAQASIATQQLADQSLSAEARQQARALAKAKRTDLAKYLPDQAAELLFLDGKMALLDGDFPKARRLLAEFLKKTGDSGEAGLEANMLMADIGLRTTPQEPGLAREHLRKVLQARPGSVELRMMLASVERMLQNYEAATAIYRSILQLEPDHAGAKAELETMKALTEGSKVKDPIDQVLIDAERVSKGTSEKLGDNEAATQLLERALIEHNYEPRIAYVLVGVKFATDREAARQLLDTSIQKRPDDTSAAGKRLRDLAERLKAADTLEGTVAFINASGSTPVEKQLGLYRAYTDFKKPEEAAKALDEAEKVAPDNATVVELRFQKCIQDGDIPGAARIAERAARENLDQAEGDTFKARVQIAQKSYKDAAATLGRAVERGNATAGVCRLLGLVQAELGRTQDAMASFRRALDLVPTDLATLKLYIGVLVGAGEITEALGVARKSESVGRNDPEFLNTWLQLEARSGRTDFARTFREQIRARNPKNVENTGSLAELYLEAKMWDPSRQLIDTLRRDSDSLRAAMLDARWHADRGALGPAKQVLRQYIGGLETPKSKQEAYLAFGQFLQRRGAEQEAMAAFRQAADYQDREKMDVDLLIGDLLINSGKFEDAEKAYRRVIDAGVKDPELVIRKRLIEALNQQQKFADAEAVFVALGADADRDVELMAQRASVARGLGDTNKAKEILDRAVTRFPDEPMPYLRRARLLVQDPALAKDVAADLATAIRLRPAFWQALRTRAMIAISEGRVDEGLRDLREAVSRNPGLDDLRLEYVDYLVRLGHETEAVDSVDEALKARANDARFIGQFASAFGRAGRWTRASKYYRMLWIQLQDEETALAYCNALINSTPPALADAEAVLATRELKTDRSWRLLLARAIIRKKQNKDAQAKEDLLASFDQIGNDPAAFNIWARDLAGVFPDSMERLKLLNQVRPPTQLTDWVTLARADVALEDKANVTEAIEALRKLRDTSVDNDLRTSIQASLSDAMIRQEKWDEAVKELKLGLQFRPNDAVFLNNAAAILTEHVKNTSEALPLAERACALNPLSWAFADTLASTYWAKGDKSQAITKLTEALRLASTEVDKARTSIKLARWKVASGDVAGGRAVADVVRESLTDSPALRDTVKSEYESLLSELNGK